MEVFAITILVAIAIGVLASSAKTKKLKAAPSGATRIETVRAQRVNGIMRQYAAAGWTTVNQSSAKSLGTQTRVTITFRKP